MSNPPDNTSQLQRELDDTRLRLAEAEETLNAIRNGEVDGLVIAGAEGQQVFTLQGAQEPYRLLIEQMSEGALTLSQDGVILYANQHFAQLLQLPPGHVIGAPLRNFVVPADHPALAGLLAAAVRGRTAEELSFRAADGSVVPVRLGLSRLQLGAETLLCAVATDITLEKKREDDLQQLAAELEARVAERIRDLAASRLATLNMMEEEVEARQAADEANRCLTQEITERMQAQAELAQAKALLQAALDCSSAGIAIADAPSGLLRYVNRAGLLIRGANEAEVVAGVDINQYVASWKLLDLDGTPLKREEVPLARAVLFGEQNRREFVIRRDEHEDRTVLANAAPIRNPEGKVIAGIVVFVDITESKRTEAALATRLRIASILSSVHDDAMYNEVLNVVLNVMHSPFGVFGYLEEDGTHVVPTMTRQIWDECPVPEKTIRFPRETWGDSSWCRAYREKKANYTNAVAKTPAGHVPVTRHISLPILFHGEAIGLFQVANKATDYSEEDVRELGAIAEQVAPLLHARLQRDWAEAKIRQVNTDLEQRVLDRTAALTAANQELEAFSYSVSHDLRAPLRHVQGYVDMLTHEAEGRLSDKGRRYMQTIMDASREMGELIDELLAFSRMGRAEMMETSVNLNALVQETLRDLETTTTGRHIVWTLPPLPAVQADPPMLKQVMTNLLGNAVKFTRPRDPAVIEVGVLNEESGTGTESAAPPDSSCCLPRSTFFVRDNGVGFDPQYTHKLFGVFQRLHRADEFEGTGIGLANVRRIIARHGGRTWAEGKLNEGATFYFTLKTSK